MSFMRIHMAETLMESAEAVFGQATHLYRAPR